jgi:glycosyltransferase involved in cell wall biosynthesis
MITELLKDFDLLKKMGETGREDVNRRFTWDNTVDKLEKIFYETQKGKGRHNHR